MKGLFKTAPGEGNMELREVPAPKPGSGQVVIKIKAAGICGSDIHIYHWDIGFPMRPPMIVGHEFSGTIAEIGEGVTGWKIGDRVTSMTTAFSCGHCRYCRAGFQNLCQERKTMGYWVDGAFADYVRVAAHRLHRLPENIDFFEGALTEPLACCIHGILELTGISAGNLVVVSGPGAIGLLSMQLAKAEGGRVIVIGTSSDKERLKRARELGADLTLILDKDDVIQQVRDLTEGYGADVVLECSGASPAVDMGLDLVRKQGKYTQIGLFGRLVQTDFEKIVYKEIKVTGSLSQRWTSWKRALLLMAEGKIKVKPLISHVFPLSDWKQGFEMLESKKSLKVILEP